MPSTNIIYVPTVENNHHGDAEDKMNMSENTWNEEISINGDYDATFEFAWDKEVDLSGHNINTLNDGYQAAKEEIKNQYFTLTYEYDAILVFDERSVSGGAGLAPVGGPTKVRDDKQKQAGSNGGNIAYRSHNLSGAIDLHEILHMYGGIHRRHDTNGWVEHTAIGNSGTKTCSGGTSDFCTRTRVINGCTEGDVRHYMDYWHDEDLTF